MQTTQYQFRRDDDHGTLSAGQLSALFMLATEEQDKTYELFRAIEISHGVRMPWLEACWRDWSHIRSCLADCLELPRHNDYFYGGGDPFDERVPQDPIWRHRFVIDDRSLPVWDEEHRPRPIFLGPGHVAILADAAKGRGWDYIAETLVVAAEIEV